jgi:hypothetical protein
VTTAVDSSVLWAVFKGEPAGAAWLERLVVVRKESRLTACEVVWAETRPAFVSAGEHAAALESLGITFNPIEARTAVLAGEIFERYRRAGGPRERILPDFLIGAHALNQTRQIASADGGFFRKYFQKLSVVTL